MNYSNQGAAHQPCATASPSRLALLVVLAFLFWPFALVLVAGGHR